MSVKTIKVDYTAKYVLIVGCRMNGWIQNSVKISFSIQKF